MTKNIAVIKGDGIGPEIVEQALKILSKIGERYNTHFNFSYALMGGIAIDETGEPLPAETVEICKNSDSVLLGAVGGPKWDKGEGNLRPEAGLLGIRKALGLFANIRPVKLIDALSGACPLKDSQKIDLIIVRELIGGAYFGKRETYIDENGHRTAYDTMAYKDYEISRIAKVAFRLASLRRGKVISVDKANVLDSSRLWREIVHQEFSKNEYKNLELSDMLVDNAAMQLIRNPRQFDVVVTENLFGDILSDEASMLTGSLGMLPSASLGVGLCGLYEPIHGSAPDIAGQDKANPLATILSTAMMLRFSLNMEAAANDIEKAVDSALNKGCRTADIMSSGMSLLSCSEMGKAVLNEI
ncbi:MAG: 3-isopropylmalate dehydrogenase [Eubacterium sp.]|jgi:3-isopropylmalate dehydrogenase|nr:3-isopropylmalate dehydrogenase [Eubacterium sp.]